MEYLPEPPATVEAGPNIAAPSADNTWLPGCWVWQQGRYAWRPGFWAAVQPDWDWVPAHYVCAPRGYVFVDGYWDYSVGRRGVLFAPVYFNAGVYARPGFSYSPATVIDLGVFANHLFLRPQYQHYYFGDYYAANYQAAGFYPSYSFNSGRYGYDPIYAHERWQHRQDGQWEHRVAADFQNRRDHEDARPPRTWAAQRALGAAWSAGQETRTSVVAAPFSQFTKSQNSPLRFQPVDQAERQQLGQHGQEVQRFREERQKLETSAAAPSADQRCQGIRAGQSDTSQVSDCGEARRRTRQGPRSAEDVRGSQAGSQGRAQAESESIAGAAAATHGEPAAARHGTTNQPPGRTGGAAPQPSPGRTAGAAAPASGRTAGAAAPARAERPAPQPQPSPGRTAGPATAGG